MLYVLNVALDSPYPTPTPVYSPHRPQGQSPPIYQPISELESPAAPIHNFSTSSQQSFELQSSQTSFSPRRPYINRSTPSVNGLGITSTNSAPSPNPSTAYELSPSPFSRPTHAHTFSKEGNARPGAVEWGGVFNTIGIKYHKGG